MNYKKAQDPQNSPNKQRTQQPKETKSHDTTSLCLCHGWTSHNSLNTLSYSVPSGLSAWK
jgi:hypothetical protein